MTVVRTNWDRIMASKEELARELIHNEYDEYQKIYKWYGKLGPGFSWSSFPSKEEALESTIKWLDLEDDREVEARNILFQEELKTRKILAQKMEQIAIQKAAAEKAESQNGK